ncbi:MAG: hypothetical protein U0599_12870 [Vicinamibacteria bacterium]
MPKRAMTFGASVRGMWMICETVVEGEGHQALAQQGQDQRDALQVERRSASTGSQVSSGSQTPPATRTAHPW